MPLKKATLPVYDNDTRALRRIFGRYPTGVVALIADTGQGPMGIAASSFTVGVSLEPPLVSCAIRKESRTWLQLRQAERIGVSVFAETQDQLMSQIASSSAPESRFDGVALSHVDSTARFLDGSPIWFECTLYEELTAGDHEIALLKVEAAGAAEEIHPLIFYGSTPRKLHVP